MRNALIFIVLMACCGIVIPVFGQSKTQVKEMITKSGLNGTYFMENKGQWPENILFLARINTTYCWISKNGIQYDAYIYANDGEESIKESYQIKYTNANNNVDIETVNPASGVFNIISGSESTNAIGIKRYEEVVLHNIYDGIDIRYYFEDSNIRYDFIVSANSHPENIILEMQGHKSIYIDENNDLVIELDQQKIKHTGLKAFQNIDNINIKVEAIFNLIDDSHISIEIGNYDRNYELIIDPVIVGTYVEYIWPQIGESQDEVIGIDVNMMGEILVTGRTDMGKYFINTDSGTGVWGNVSDVYPFIAKYNSDGSLSFVTVLLIDYNFTFMRGEGIDCRFIFNSSQNLGLSFVDQDYSHPEYAFVGNTNGQFSHPANGFQTTFAGGSDMFLCLIGDAFGAPGSIVNYLTYLGGENADIVEQMRMEYSNGYNIHLIGSTISPDFPVIDGNPYENNNFNGVYSIINPTLSAEPAQHVKSHCYSLLDHHVFGKCLQLYMGDVYVSGYYSSGSNNQTAYIYKFTPTTPVTDVIPMRSVYNSSSPDYLIDKINDIDLNSEGYPFIAGQRSLNSSYGSHGWVAKLYPTDQTGSMIISEYSYGQGDVSLEEYGSFFYDIAINSCDKVFAYGGTDVPSIQMTSDPDKYQTTYGGGYDALLVRFNDVLSSVEYATYIGGSNDDQYYDGRESFASHYNTFYLTSNSNAMVFKNHNMNQTEIYFGCRTFSYGLETKTNPDRPVYGGANRLDGYIAGMQFITDCTPCCDSYLLTCFELQSGDKLLHIDIVPVMGCSISGSGIVEFLSGSTVVSTETFSSFPALVKYPTTTVTDVNIILDASQILCFKALPTSCQLQDCCGNISVDCDFSQDEQGNTVMEYTINNTGTSTCDINITKMVVTDSQGNDNEILNPGLSETATFDALNKLPVTIDLYSGDILICSKTFNCSSACCDQFTANCYTINGISHVRLDYIPNGFCDNIQSVDFYEDGEYTVPVPGAPFSFPIILPYTPNGSTMDHFNIVLENGNECDIYIPECEQGDCCPPDMDTWIVFSVADPAICSCALGECCIAIDLNLPTEYENCFDGWALDPEDDTELVSETLYACVDNTDGSLLTILFYKSGDPDPCSVTLIVDCSANSKDCCDNLNIECSQNFGVLGVTRDYVIDYINPGDPCSQLISKAKIIDNNGNVTIIDPIVFPIEYLNVPEENLPINIELYNGNDLLCQKELQCSNSCCLQFEVTCTIWPMSVPGSLNYGTQYVTFFYEFIPGCSGPVSIKYVYDDDYEDIKPYVSTPQVETNIISNSYINKISKVIIILEDGTECEVDLDWCPPNQDPDPTDTWPLLSSPGINQVPDQTYNLNLQPNPASDEVQVSYTLREKCHVRIDLVNSLGQVVVNAFEGMRKAGPQSMNIKTDTLPEGVYFVRLTGPCGNYSVPLSVRH